MKKNNPVQMNTNGIDATVSGEVRTVEYYRQRFLDLATLFEGNSDICNKIEQIDSDYAGRPGLFTVQNVSAGRAGLGRTASVVDLMTQVLKAEGRLPATNRLARQKLKNT